ncbi:MAG: (d)CMP kinase [Verrucomicrobia bacterium]|nr:(d)CMP kinase [Verrucomicrobiota bacterium]
MTNKVVAIDGPSASGKSTVARRVADALGWLYVDSGSLYRAVAWKALKDGIDVQSSEALADLSATTAPEFFVCEGAVRFRLDGVVLDRELRAERINRNVSPVAADPTVRARVTQWLHDMLLLGNLVMEGRDIGTAVFPASRHKFYLDASPEERARRRHAEMADVETDMSVGDVHASLNRRDTIDSRRMTAPLSVADDATIVDSTQMDIAGVVEFVVEHVKGVL